MILIYFIKYLNDANFFLLQRNVPVENISTGLVDVDFTPLLSNLLHQHWFILNTFLSFSLVWKYRITSFSYAIFFPFISLPRNIMLLHFISEETYFLILFIPSISMYGARSYCILVTGLPFPFKTIHQNYCWFIHYLNLY